MTYEGSAHIEQEELVEGVWVEDTNVTFKCEYTKGCWGHRDDCGNQVEPDEADTMKVVELNANGIDLDPEVIKTEFLNQIIDAAYLLHQNRES